MKTNIIPKYRVVVKMDGRTTAQSTQPLAYKEAFSQLNVMADQLVCGLRMIGRKITRECSWGGEDPYKRAEIPEHVKNICPFASYVLMKRVLQCRKEHLLTFELQVTYNY